MKNKSSVTTLIVFLFSLTAVFGQSFNEARADSLFDILAAKNKAMGSLAIYKEGNIIYDRAVGYLEISPEKGEMILNQGGGKFTFTKEK